MSEDRTPQEPTPGGRQVDYSLSPLQLVDRIVSLLFWVIIPVVLGAVLIMVAYFYALISNPSGVAAHPEIHDQLSSLVRQFLPSAEGLARAVWSFLAPVLSLIVIIALLKWLLLSERENVFGRQLGRMLKDVPSLIAVIVLITLCLLPIVRVGIPEPLGNIALVIVGFYFGTQRRGKPSADKVESQDPSDLSNDS